MKSRSVFVFLFVIVLLYQEVNNCQIVQELIGNAMSDEEVKSKNSTKESFTEGTIEITFWKLNLG